MKIKILNNAAFKGLLFILVVLTACELAEVNQPDAEPEIFEPTTIPGSIAEFNDALHGGSSRSWYSVSFTLVGLNGLQDCRLDDIIEIKADGTYHYDGGALLCGAEDNQQEREGTWQVINDGKNIVFDEETEREYTALVNGFDKNTLSISGDYLGLAIKGIYIIN